LLVPRGIKHKAIPPSELAETSWPEKLRSAVSFIRASGSKQTRHAPKHDMSCEVDLDQSDMSAFPIGLQINKRDAQRH
jgi:hypothetical protein